VTNLEVTGTMSQAHLFSRLSEALQSPLGLLIHSTRGRFSCCTVPFFALPGFLGTVAHGPFQRLRHRSAGAAPCRSRDHVSSLRASSTAGTCHQWVRRSGFPSVLLDVLDSADDLRVAARRCSSYAIRHSGTLNLMSIMVRFRAC
jgi:hypothetical protein